MSQENNNQMIKGQCAHHGKLEANVKNVEKGMERLEAGQKVMIEKIDKFMSIRIQDFQACETHRNTLKAYADQKVSKATKSLTTDIDAVVINVKENKENTSSNTKRTNNIYSYAKAFIFIFGVVVTIIKLI